MRQAQRNLYTQGCSITPKYFAADKKTVTHLLQWEVSWFFSRALHAFTMKPVIRDCSAVGKNCRNANF